MLHLVRALDPSIDRSIEEAFGGERFESSTGSWDRPRGRKGGDPKKVGKKTLELVCVCVAVICLKVAS